MHPSVGLSGQVHDCNDGPVAQQADVSFSSPGLDALQAEGVPAGVHSSCVGWPRQTGHVLSPGASCGCSCYGWLIVPVAATTWRWSFPRVGPGARRLAAACCPQHLPCLEDHWKDLNALHATSVPPVDLLQTERGSKYSSSKYTLAF